VKPSVGRIVHYVAYGTPGGEFPSGICRAAVVTEVPKVDDPDPVGTVRETDGEGNVTTIGLCVLNPTGMYFNRETKYNEEPKPGTWHWPEKV